MGKYCILCKAEAVTGVSGRSFHRFPAPRYLREKWCEILKKDMDKLNNWTYVCSDHFSPEYFIYRSNGQRFLNDDAIPEPFQGVVHVRKRRKKKSKKQRSNLDNDKIKTEGQEQESLNTFLDIEIEEKDTFPKTEVICKTGGQDQESLNTFLDIEMEKKDTFPKSEVICKTEGQEQKSLNTFLDIEIEEKDTFPKSEIICIKTEKTPEIYQKDLGDFDAVEDISVKCEPPEDIDFKNDDGHQLPQRNAVQNELLETSGTLDESEIGKSLFQSMVLSEMIHKLSDEEDDDVLAKGFKFLYPKPLEGEAYSCAECPFTTPGRATLRKHFLGHRDAEYKKNPGLYADYKTYRCDQCKYVTIQKGNLQRHKVKHLPKDDKSVKTYVCDQCEYSTKYRCDIVKHRIKHVVPTGERFLCTKCAYEAYYQSGLEEHLEKGHIENKKYKYECDHCPFKTDSKSGLNRHVRDSHSSRPYKYECKYCSFKNDSKYSLNLHMKMGHTGETGSIQFKA